MLLGSCSYRNPDKISVHHRSTTILLTTFGVDFADGHQILAGDELLPSSLGLGLRRDFAVVVVDGVRAAAAAADIARM